MHPKSCIFHAILTFPKSWQGASGKIFRWAGSAYESFWLFLNDFWSVLGHLKLTNKLRFFYFCCAFGHRSVVIFQRFWCFCWNHVLLRMRDIIQEAGHWYVVAQKAFRVTPAVTKVDSLLRASSQKYNALEWFWNPWKAFGHQSGFLKLSKIFAH